MVLSRWYEKHRATWKMEWWRSISKSTATHTHKQASKHSTAVCIWHTFKRLHSRSICDTFHLFSIYIGGISYDMAKWKTLQAMHSYGFIYIYLQIMATIKIRMASEELRYAKVTLILWIYHGTMAILLLPPHIHIKSVYIYTPCFVSLIVPFQIVFLWQLLIIWIRQGWKQISKINSIQKWIYTYITESN